MNWYKKALKEYEKIPEGGTYLANWFPKDRPKETDDISIDWLKDKWTPVKSSFITHVAYYEPLKMFEVKLKNGSEYSFKGVPKRVFNAFMKAKSKGEFFNKVIKKRYSQLN